MRSIASRIERGERLVLAAHSLLEAYSVLTGMPSPHAIPADDAWSALKANFIDNASLISLTPEEYRAMLQALPREVVKGGRCYDRLIAACLRKGKVSLLLTYNVKHFDAYHDGFAIEQPN